MLSIILITVALQSTVANCSLNKSPIDGVQRIDNDVVADILQTFYDDLIRVRAITGLWQMTKATEHYTDEHTAEGVNLLEDINSFCLDVDKRYGIKRSPNPTLLAEVAQSLEGQTTPWIEIRTRGLNMEAQRANYPSDHEPSRSKYTGLS